RTHAAQACRSAPGSAGLRRATAYRQLPTFSTAAPEGTPTAGEGITARVSGWEPVASCRLGYGDAGFRACGRPPGAPGKIVRVPKYCVSRMFGLGFGHGHVTTR